MILPRHATYPNKKCLVLVEEKVPSTTNLFQAARNPSASKAASPPCCWRGVRGSHRDRGPKKCSAGVATASSSSVRLHVSSQTLAAANV